MNPTKTIVNRISKKANMAKSSLQAIGNNVDLLDGNLSFSLTHPWCPLVDNFRTAILAIAA